MPLPRSVVEFSKGSKKARHVDSANFRGFSFIQEDFLLPERDKDEIEEYWNSADEDAESVSECASSKMGLDLGDAEAEPEKKKRPPRKRKKKKKATDTASVASSDGGIKTPPIQNGEKEEPATKEYTIKALENSNITPQKTVEVPLAQNQPIVSHLTPAEPVEPTQSIKTVSKNPATTPAQKLPPKAPPKEETWQSVGSAEKKGLQPLRPKATQTQKYIPPQQRGGTNQQSRGWTGPQQQLRYPQHGAQATLSMRQPNPQAYHMQQPQQHVSAARSPGWGTNAQRQQQQQHSRQQPNHTGNRGWATVGPVNVAPSVSATTSKSPAQGSWASKISTSQQQQAQRRMSPHDLKTGIQPVIPPSPSSDWTKHSMSSSPRHKVVKTPDNWPSLGDFPAPPTLNQGTSAKKPQPLAGAWGARKR